MPPHHRPAARGGDPPGAALPAACRPTTPGAEPSAACPRCCLPLLTGPRRPRLRLWHQCTHPATAGPHAATAVSPKVSPTCDSTGGRGTAVPFLPARPLTCSCRWRALMGRLASTPSHPANSLHGMFGILALLMYSTSSSTPSTQRVCARDLPLPAPPTRTRTLPYPLPQPSSLQVSNRQQYSFPPVTPSLPSPTLRQCVAPPWHAPQAVTAAVWGPANPIRSPRVFHKFDFCFMMEM